MWNTYYEKKLSHVQVKIRSNPTAHEERYSYTSICLATFRCRRGWRKRKCVLPFWSWVYYGYMRFARSVLSSPPFPNDIYMHEYNHSMLSNRLLCWYNTITMRPWCIHFGGERNAKKNENLIVKTQQAAANSSVISPTTWYFFSNN